METGEKDWLEGYDPIASGEQDEWGCDIWGIRDNLALTPTERVRKHALGIRSLYILQNARRVLGRRTDAPDTA